MSRDPRRQTPTTLDTDRDQEAELGASMSHVAPEDRVISDALQDEVEAEIDTADDRRVIKAETQGGQGPKTRSRNKQIVSGKPYD